jgi:hypothetical protein
MRRRSRAEWAALVAEFRRSGESVAKFAAKRGLQVSSLKWWCWRLGEAKRSQAEEREAVRLVPIDVVGLAAGASSSSTIVIATAGAEIRIEAGIDVAYVGALVRELQSRC